MSCNHCAKASEDAARQAGAPELEATWAGNREHPKFCSICHGFLRADGGCTKCEDKLVESAWQDPTPFAEAYQAGNYSPGVMRDLAPVMVNSPDPAVRTVAAINLDDAPLLGDLANDPEIAVQSAVAGNSITSPATLQKLLDSPSPSVYRAAAYNPAMPHETLEVANKNAKKQWLDLAQKAVRPLIYQQMFSGRGKNQGGWLLPAVMVGMYGPAIYKVLQRKRTMEQALDKQQNSPPVPPTPRNPSSLRDRRFNEKERRLVDEELKIAESCFTLSDDYYDGMFTIEDVFHLRENGADNDRMAEISGYLLQRATEMARQLPGWYEGEGAEVEDFEQMQQKLRCQKCGRYAGWRNHQCRPAPSVVPPEFPEQAELPV